ncbi:hypothetical protein CLAIMM_05696, partial [Cladophialophora immunda]
MVPGSPGPATLWTALGAQIQFATSLFQIFIAVSITNLWLAIPHTLLSPNSNTLPGRVRMAYLLVAGVVLLRQKLHEHKELQREKKRLAYEERYRDLAHEHASRIGSHQQHVLAKPGSGHAEARHELSA